MRILAIIPELTHDNFRGRALNLLRQRSLWKIPVLRDWLVHPSLFTGVAWGGTLNLMRHAALARSLGADTALVTPHGRDTYGRYNVVDLPFLPWDTIRPDDVCIVPDFCTDLTDRISGRVIVYLQVPIHVRADFDYKHPRVRLWTDSPFMRDRCRDVFPGKDVAVVPNIIDPRMFPFRPQAEREPGLIFAFPRKGPEYIEATRNCYSSRGGKYWKFELVNGLSIHELARQMQRPQAFLASADDEGCALPPQESMAAGIVVVGKNARGANFSMEHRRTALVAETPDEAAACLREIEDHSLREEIARNGRDYISRFFPENEPTTLWQETLREFGFPVRKPATHFSTSAVAAS